MKKDLEIQKKVPNEISEAEKLKQAKAQRVIDGLRKRMFVAVKKALRPFFNRRLTKKLILRMRIKTKKVLAQYLDDPTIVNNLSGQIMIGNLVEKNVNMKKALAEEKLEEAEKDESKK